MNTPATIRRRTLSCGKAACLAGAFAVLAAITVPAFAERVTAPLVCNKGPAGQRFVVVVNAPGEAVAGSTYAVRIDGMSSGKISHFGLNHIHDMTVDYLLPEGASYVEGSAHLVAGTGTANVLVHPRLWHRAGVLTLNLPDKVENGSSYTPPSIQLRLKAVGAPGSSATVGFNQYRLKANAFLIGDVAVTCNPAPKPHPIGTTRITALAPVPRN